MPEATPLMADELDSLNRIAPKPKPVPAPAPEPEKPAKPEIDKPDAEVIARARALAASAQNQSTFVHEENGKIVAQAGDVVAAPKGDWHGKPVEDPVSADEKSDFLAMLLGAPHFEKRYDLYGGNLALTFRTRTAELESMCVKQTRDDALLDGPYGPVSSREESDQRVIRYMLYRCVASLVEIKRNGQLAESFDAAKTVVTIQDKPGVGPLRAARLKLEGSMPGPVWSVIRDYAIKFEQLCARLTEESENPDFWKAGSAS